MVEIGLLVQRDDVRLARGKWGFKSPAVHWFGLGPIVQGEDASSAN